MPAFIPIPSACATPRQLTSQPAWRSRWLRQYYLSSHYYFYRVYSLGRSRCRMTTEKVPGRVACDSHRGGLSLYFLILCIFTQAHLCMPASQTHTFFPLLHWSVLYFNQNCFYSVLCRPLQLLYKWIQSWTHPVCKMRIHFRLLKTLTALFSGANNQKSRPPWFEDNLSQGKILKSQYSKLWRAQLVLTACPSKSPCGVHWDT